MIYFANNLEDTKHIAEDFASSLKLGDVVLLNGDLGAGKTTFTQFAFKKLGVKQNVNSPTFAVLKSYEANGKTLHHFDAYRINTPEAIESGFDEILSNRKSIIFIEWSENIMKLLPKNSKTINIKIIDENQRKIEIN